MHGRKRSSSLLSLAGVLPRLKDLALYFALATAVGGAVFAATGCGGSDSPSSTVQAARLKKQAVAKSHELQVLKAELQLEKEREAIRKAHASLAGQDPGEAPVSQSSLTGFRELEQTLPGEIGVAIGPPGSGPAASTGTLRSGSAWSTSKVPVVMRVLAEAGGPSGLSSSQQDEVRRALTLSDNEAALALFGDLERAHRGPLGAASAVDEVLREAGDESTQVSSRGRDGFTPFGQTEWPLDQQELFMSRLAAGCIGSPESTEYVLGLMGEVTSDSWGLGSAGLPARWKGGWGPGTDGRYLARQMGVLDVGGKEAVVALAVLPDDGQFATAESMATSVAKWLAQRAPEFAAPPGGC
ncbi:MAG TPA: hypothetical protein VGQ28_02790 [Thermoanaerobaculia bacterium]|jgi:hypothetical protein|nr:hypothetical protein [Thermoanaerobaculia bacterium]